jgi:hypothetical protein
MAMKLERRKREEDKKRRLGTICHIGCLSRGHIVGMSIFCAIQDSAFLVALCGFPRYGRSPGTSCLPQTLFSQRQHINGYIFMFWVQQTFSGAADGSKSSRWSEDGGVDAAKWFLLLIIGRRKSRFIVQ